MFTNANACNICVLDRKHKLPFIRSLYRRIPLEFYGKISKTLYHSLTPFGAYLKDKRKFVRVEPSMVHKVGCKTQVRVTKYKKYHFLSGSSACE